MEIKIRTSSVVLVVLVLGSSIAVLGGFNDHSFWKAKGFKGGFGEIWDTDMAKVLLFPYCKWYIRYHTCWDFIHAGLFFFENYRVQWCKGSRLAENS